MKEEEHINRGRGKWSQEGVPHKGWTCVDIEDLGEPTKTCEMCESQEIRYVHYMEHKDYPEILIVGCVCAGHMEQNLHNAVQRDDFMKSRANKRNKWLTRNWKISAKGNAYIKSDGYIITVFLKNNSWNAQVKSQDGKYERYSEKRYNSQDEAKLAAFNFITKLLSDSMSI
jgi:hypothetical protein